ncbi:MAG: binding-protein-dependent transport system inner rane component [Thermoleophilia bacterium]|nr:binding-protein-dependent transport system inner rane component [Thermoleophilia bacterium]
MSALLVRRLAAMPVILLVTSVLVFFVLSMGPSPMAQLMEVANLSPEELARIAHQYGWDLPAHSQYLHWLRDVARGDLGMSVRTFRPAAEMIGERLPLTLTIASISLALSVGIGVPIGAYCAVRANSRLDYATTFMTLALMAMPGFFMALVLQLFAVGLRDALGGVVFFTSGTPESGASMIEWAQRLTLPVLTLTLTHIAVWARYQRGELLGVLGEQYIVCARAKGLPAKTIFLRHAMRNATLPIITLIAIDMGKLVAGAVVVESVFGLPGIGTLLLDSVNGNDTVVVLDILMLVGVMMVLCNAIADVVYGALDPRVRVGG